MGFVYERVPHITLKSIANNAEIDVIWERYQAELEPLRAALNAALGRSADPHPASLPPRGAGEGGAIGEAAASSPRPRKREREGPAQREGEGTAAWEEWEIPREAGPSWPAEAKAAHAKWWDRRIARQKEIDASIAAKAEVEYLYDKPYADPRASASPVRSPSRRSRRTACSPSVTTMS